MCFQFNKQYLPVINFSTGRDREATTDMSTFALGCLTTRNSFTTFKWDVLNTTNSCKLQEKDQIKKSW